MSEDCNSYAMISTGILIEHLDVPCEEICSEELLYRYQFFQAIFLGFQYESSFLFDIYNENMVSSNNDSGSNVLHLIKYSITVTAAIHIL